MASLHHMWRGAAAAAASRAVCGAAARPRHCCSWWSRYSHTFRSSQSPTLLVRSCCSDRVFYRRQHGTSLFSSSRNSNSSRRTYSTTSSSSKYTRSCMRSCSTRRNCAFRSRFDNGSNSDDYYSRSLLGKSYSSSSGAFVCRLDDSNSSLSRFLSRQRHCTNSDCAPCSNDEASRSSTSSIATTLSLNRLSSDNNSRSSRNHSSGDKEGIRRKVLRRSTRGGNSGFLLGSSALISVSCLCRASRCSSWSSNSAFSMSSRSSCRERKKNSSRNHASAFDTGGSSSIKSSSRSSTHSSRFSGRQCVYHHFLPGHQTEIGRSCGSPSRAYGSLSVCRFQLQQFPFVRFDGRLLVVRSVEEDAVACTALLASATEAASRKRQKKPAGASYSSSAVAGARSSCSMSPGSSLSDPPDAASASAASAAEGEIVLGYDTEHDPGDAFFDFESGCVPPLFSPDDDFSAAAAAASPGWAASPPFPCCRRYHPVSPPSAASLLSPSDASSSAAPSAASSSAASSPSFPSSSCVASACCPSSSSVVSSSISHLHRSKRPHTATAGPPHAPLALIQLASASVAVVWQLQQLGGLPEGLLKLLQREDIVKATQGAAAEAAALQREYGFTPENFACIRSAAIAVGCAPHSRSLQALCGIFLRRNLDKRMQCSRWSSKQLSEEQLLYAATDAFVSREIYLRLQKTLHRSSLYSLSFAGHSTKKDVVGSGCSSGAQRRNSSSAHCQDPASSASSYVTRNSDTAAVNRRATSRSSTDSRNTTTRSTNTSDISADSNVNDSNTSTALGRRVTVSTSRETYTSSLKEEHGDISTPLFSPPFAAAAVTAVTAFNSSGKAATVQTVSQDDTAPSLCRGSSGTVSGTSALSRDADTEEAAGFPAVVAVLRDGASAQSSAGVTLAAAGAAAAASSSPAPSCELSSTAGRTHYERLRSLCLSKGWQLQCGEVEVGYGGIRSVFTVKCGGPTTAGTAAGTPAIQAIRGSRSVVGGSRCGIAVAATARAAGGVTACHIVETTTGSHEGGCDDDDETTTAAVVRQDASAAGDGSDNFGADAGGEAAAAAGGELTTITARSAGTHTTLRGAQEDAASQLLFCLWRSNNL